MTIDYYAKPILTARETARYLGMPESTLDVWLLDRGQEALVHAVEPERRGWPRVPFVGVIEAYVLRALRDLKLPMDEIRKAAELVRHEFDDPYALARDAQVRGRLSDLGAALYTSKDAVVFPISCLEASLAWSPPCFLPICRATRDFL